MTNVAYFMDDVFTLRNIVVVGVLIFGGFLAWMITINIRDRTGAHAIKRVVKQPVRQIDMRGMIQPADNLLQWVPERVASLPDVTETLELQLGWSPTIEDEFSGTRWEDPRDTVDGETDQGEISEDERARILDRMTKKD